MNGLKIQRQSRRRELFQYAFGDESYKVIHARSFEEAIFEFKATCHDPERYCRVADRVTDENGKYVKKEHNSCESAFELVPDAQILVTERKQIQGKWEDTGRCRLISLDECINFSYEEFNHVAGLIGLQDQREELGKTNSKAVILAERNRLADEAAKLEKQLFDLSLQISELNNQIRNKRKILLGVSIYNGSATDCYCLLEGRPAEAGTRLSLYQEKLYIDEQIAVYSCRFGNRSFDYTNMDEFEEFLRTSFKEFHYRPLSVVAWQIRRTDKNYGDALTSLIENHWNYMTALSIRNGEQLYVVYCDEFRIGDVLFPKRSELSAIEERWKNITFSTSSKEEEIRAYYEKYVFGLLLVQGLVDRTDLLGSWNKGLDLIKGDENQLEFIRDAEPNFWLDDGHESFAEWICRNRESIKVGSRVLFTGSLTRNSYDSNWDETLMRTGCRTVDWPRYDEVYSVNAIGMWRNSKTFYKFSYLPYEPITLAAAFRREDCSDKRTRRIGFKAYDYELLNLDELRIEDIDYFLSNRKYKSQYMSILPVLSVAKKMLKREIQEEQNFKVFIRNQLGFEVSDDELDEAIVQFKTKKFKRVDERKWKRGLLDDEEKGKKACSQIRDLIIFNRNRKRILAKENENGN